MTTPATPSPESDNDVVVDPITQRANLYRTLNQLWWFPSLGAALILGNSAYKGTLQAIVHSPQIEDLAAVIVLLSHAVFAIQSRRFRRLNLHPRTSNVDQTDSD